MSEALYRKYRPSTFNDVVGQEHIEQTLKNALEQHKVSHAYLFCGPRGTGKTTMARILAKALLCQKAPTTDPDGTCEECQAIAAGTHPDVYELDAASRTGVENVREEIINRVHYAPTRGSYKIYIIDEVHMLSTAAFNALLKTLEEPPSHVIFILCTTDPQVVPDTIHSRCQRFDFHRLGVEEIVAHLGAVCGQEGVEFEPEALELIAHQADGGMRNALTSLEQLAAFGEGRVTLEGAHAVLGSLDNEDLTKIVQALGRRDAAACFTWVADYVETGADIAQFVQDLAEHMRNLYLLSLTDADVEIPVSTSERASMEAELELFGPERLGHILIVLGELMKELRVTTNSRLAFEIALMRLLRPESDLTLESLAERIEQLEYRALSTPNSTQAALVAAAQAPSYPVQAQVEHAPMQASLHSPAPAPAPALQQAPAPAPTPIPQAPSASQPQPANYQQPGQQASGMQSSAQRSNSSIDLGNAAELQRLWQKVTTNLRSANPARGVLFMGTKIEANPQGGGVFIVFSSDSNFAYEAAQKKEVKELLAQSFINVTGAPVEFQLSIGKGGAAHANPAQPATPAVQAKPQQQASRIQTPISQAVSQAVSASSPSAQAGVVAQAASAAAVPTAQQAPTPVSAAVAPPSPNPTASAMVAQAPSVSSAQVPPAETQATYGRYEDESPFIDEDFSPEPTPSMPTASQAPAFQQTPPVQSGVNIQAQQNTMAQSGTTSEAVSQAQPSVQITVPPTQTQSTMQTVQVAAPVSGAAQQDQAEPFVSSEGLSESEQIKQNLTAVFGEGVKFDTI